ncbi:MAG: glycoside hydrolase family 9 protein [Ruminococcus sp.]|nr:glycoside hydrolase family 9 protein [Ruminococcus sp.]
MLAKRMLAAAAAICTAGTLLTALPNSVFAGQLLGQTDFSDGVGLPWHVCESATGEMEFEISDGVYRITIVNPGGASNGGEDRWDCQFRHRGLTIESGKHYTVSFDITASKDCTYYTKIGDLAEPFAEDWHGEPDDSQHEAYWNVQPLTANKTVTVNGSFTATRTAEVEWAFHIGGDSVPAGTVFTFDDMSLICTDSDTYDYVKPETWNRAGILTNQVNYFPQLEKKATLLSDQTSSVSFSLLDESGKTVFTGDSSVLGEDADSGDSVHVLDFSKFQEPGTYTLEADGQKSRSFSIGGTAYYSGMLYDALNYFYQNRSGIAIESQFITSGDSTSLARAAGHSNDTARITTDWDDLNSNGGTQDVTGGWYDAGDHGKYVVNGGISLWMMQNQYEHAKQKGDTSAYEDGTMSIPENNNGYPDLLDEARWEMEWMLKMIVQDGEYADMAYHKVHDIKWTALGMTPADDTLERILKPPTTCATLNLAACAAQASRLWRDLDSDFSKQCLDAAEAAYAAAKKHPDLYAPIDQSIGGGPYGDDDATDEFYWAAAELYLTTGDSSYQKDMKASDWYLDVPTTLKGGESVDTVASFDWGHTAALGSISLSLYPDQLGKDAEKLSDAFSEAADTYLQLEDEQGYGQPYAASTISSSDSDNGYVWGSNSFVIDNAIILAYAYDLTDNTDYLNGAATAMDYLLGRNPVDYSYVTGYGTHAVQYPHHRFWAHQLSESFPMAPSGVLVGGPNSGMEDPWVQGSGWKKGEIPPAKCYLDHIEAWSVNECTINWNEPLAWMTAFLCDATDGIMVGSVSQADAIESAENSTTAAADSDSESIMHTTKQAAAAAAQSEQDSNDSASHFPIKLLIILGAVLIGLIAVEVFVYKMVKLSKQGK